MVTAIVLLVNYANCFKMIVGYAIDHIIGLALSILLTFLISRNSLRYIDLAQECLITYAYCAIFFALSTEIATLIVLIREEFGTDTNGLGDCTVRITEAVAMLVLLPQVYPMLRYSIGASNESPESRAFPNKGEGKSDRAANDDDEGTQGSNRFALLVICWALAFFPFYTKMDNAFGQSKIRRHGVISPEQFDTIEDICWRDVDQITATEDKLMTAFVMLAYIPLSLFIIGRIVVLRVQHDPPESALRRRVQALRRKAHGRVAVILTGATFVAIPLVACGLLWSVIRTRAAQQQLTASYGAFDSDNEWTFGQIVAITLFAPVVVDGWPLLQAWWWRKTEDSR